MSETFADGSPDAPLYGLIATISRQDLLASIYSTFAVATIFLSLRFVLRFRYNGRLLLDDYFMLLAWLAFTVQTILQTLQLDPLWYVTYMDFGRVSSTDPERFSQARQMSKWFFGVTALYWTVLWSVKTSLLVTFFKLVRPIAWLRRCLYAVALFTFLSYVGCWVLFALLRESPEDTYIVETGTSEHHLRVSTIYAATVDVASDVLIALLPMSILPSLHLSRGKKIGIGITFALGMLVVSVAIVRMDKITCGSGMDFVGVALWGAVETATAIVVGSLMSFGGLLTKGVEGVRRSVGYSKQSDRSKGSSKGWSDSTGTRRSGQISAHARASASDRELMGEQDEAGLRPPENVFAVHKTVETDVYSEYGRDLISEDDIIELRKKELQLA